MLGLPPTATVTVTSITDLATGSVWLAPRSARLLQVARQLGGGAAAAGSKGVSIACAVDVGKVPTQALLLNITTAVAAPAVAAAIGARVVTTIAAAAGVPASSFTVAVSAPSVANSQVHIAAPVGGAGAGASSSSSSSSSGAAVGGAVGGVVVVAAVLFAYKHLRDEKARTSQIARLRAAEERQREAEMVLAAVESINPLGGGAKPQPATMGGAREAAVQNANKVREVALRAAALERENAAGAAENAELKRRLAALEGGAGGDAAGRRVVVAFAPTGDDKKGGAR